MAKVTLVRTNSGIENALQDILKRGRSTEAFLNRVTFAQYKQAQITRWETQGASEIGKWDELTEPYATRKLKKCKNMPGAGRIVMIATSKLKDAATGQSAALFKIVSNSGMKVFIDTSSIPYAAYPGITRPFMKFSYTTEKKMVDDVVAYLMAGRET